MRCTTSFLLARILALLLVSATPVALHSSAAQMPAPPPMQPAQPRDAAPTAKGTGAISGRVTNLRPVGHCNVQ